MYDSVAILKKKMNILIDNEISRIDIVVRGDHGLDTFRFPLKITFLMNFGISRVRISNIVCVLYLKKIIVSF